MSITTKKIAKAVGEVRKKSKQRNFNQSIDLAINLRDIDMKKPENRLNEELMLPNGRGEDIKIAVIGGGELALQAKKVADKVITEEELEGFGKDKKAAKRIANNYDFFIAQADLMPLIGKTLGPVLGPRGKMPKPIPINAPIAPIVKRFKKTVRIRTKEKPIIHVAVGVEKMNDENLVENIEAILRLVERRLERGIANIKSVYIKTTMGPSIKLEV